MFGCTKEVKELIGKLNIYRWPVSNLAWTVITLNDYVSLKSASSSDLNDCHYNYFFKLPRDFNLRKLWCCINFIAKKLYFEYIFPRSSRNNAASC